MTGVERAAQLGGDSVVHPREVAIGRDVKGDWVWDIPMAGKVEVNYIWGVRGKRRIRVDSQGVVWKTG